MKYIRTKDGRIIDVSNMIEYETDSDYEYGARVFDGYGNDNIYIYSCRRYYQTSRHY